MREIESAICAVNKKVERQDFAIGQQEMRIRQLQEQQRATNRVLDKVVLGTNFAENATVSIKLDEPVPHYDRVGVQTLLRMLMDVLGVKAQQQPAQVGGITLSRKAVTRKRKTKVKKEETEA